MNKKIITAIVIITVAIILPLILVNISQNGENNNAAYAGTVTVFKSPTCGCCGNYISYLEGRGFNVETVNEQDMAGIKTQYKIPQTLESCHTSVVGDYVVEGHIPTEVIEKLLAEKPAIAGIALADMPSGSPGMPGAKFAPFEIHKITAEGQDGGIFMNF